MSEMSEFVEVAAALFADAEHDLSVAAKSVKALVPLMREGEKLGLAGYLQSSRMACDLRAAYGVIAKAESIVFAIHAEGTKIAQDKGVDLPSIEGGGDR